MISIQLLKGLQLRTSCHKLLTCLVASILHEVLLETLSEVNGLLFPYLCVSISLEVHELEIIGFFVIRKIVTIEV